MNRFEGKYQNLWKQTRHSGSKVTFIRSITDLEIALHREGTIRWAKGNGDRPFEKEELSHRSIPELNTLIQEGLVYVAPDSWI